MNINKAGVHIVRRENLPAIGEVLAMGETINIGEYRSFGQNKQLASFLSEANKGGVQIAWTALAPNQSLPAHRHPMPSLIVVCKGSGKYFGEFEADLKEGDAVLVSGTSLHGFTASEEEEMVCLSLQNDGDPIYRANSSDHRVDFAGARLIEFNQTAEAFGEQFRRQCEELEGQINLHGSAFRRIFFGNLKRWSQSFQQVLFLRQGTSTEEELGRVFFEHLEDELGHDKLLSDYEYTRSPDIEAYCTWFERKVQIHCDSEKAIIVHTVLESAGDIFSQVITTQGKDAISEYVDLHSDLDEGHASVADAQISQHVASNPEQAVAICEEAWQMFIRLFDAIQTLSLSTFENRLQTR